MALRGLQQPANSAPKPVPGMQRTEQHTASSRALAGMRFRHHRHSLVMPPGPLIAADTNGDRNNSDQWSTPPTGDSA